MNSTFDFCSLKNKNIIISGASSGIGKEVAILCSKLGANLILIGRNFEHLQETLNLMERKEFHKLIQVDLFHINEISNVLEQQVKGIIIHGFVHSAGVELTKPLKLLKNEDIDVAMKINFYSAVEIIKAISQKKYLDDSGASFVLISSIVGLFGQPGKIGYSSTKGALNSAVKSLSLELISKKIRVNSVSPAMVATKMSESLLKSLPENAKIEIEKMHPLGIGEPIDVANSVAFLLSSEAKWITGTNLIVDGGYSAK